MHPHPVREAGRNGFARKSIVVGATATLTDAATDKVTGALTDVTLGTPAGTVQLGHGRIASVDESKPRLDIVRIDAAGKPTVERYVAIPSLAGKWKRAGWLTTDASAPRP